MEEEKIPVANNCRGEYDIIHCQQFSLLEIKSIGVDDLKGSCNVSKWTKLMKQVDPDVTEPN